LSPAAVMTVGMKLCEALASVHDAGVLHLDLKPSNIFIDASAERIKLSDFGSATRLGSRREDALISRPIGTPGYMAPEQTIRGQKIGPWTDVYLLAATLWECLTAQRPSDHNRAIPRDPATTASCAALRQGLALDPTRRPADMR